jgi:hypothetical protein
MRISTVPSRGRATAVLETIGDPIARGVAVTIGAGRGVAVGARTGVGDGARPGTGVSMRITEEFPVGSGWVAAGTGDAVSPAAKT